MLLQVIIGSICSLIIAGIAYQKQSLSSSGVLAAWVVGTTIFVCGSVYWFGLLLVFFISSTMWSKYRKKLKQRVEDLFAKTGKRDALQVLANGGVGALIAVIHHYDGATIWIYLYLGVIATVNADTWGTEIGVLSRTGTRHILTWKKVEKGTSGGISAIGTFGCALGALFIGLCSYVFLWMEGQYVSVWIVAIGLVAGVSGAVADSLFGATIQKMYFCLQCQQLTEKPSHCGAPTRRKSGWRWCNNDMVNFISSILGGIVAAALYVMIF